jgi:hypothetical protein
MAERKALLGGGPLSALDSVAPADVAPEDAEVTVPESGLSAARAAMARRQTLRDEQQAFFDRIAKQLAERRTGPSTSEQLFELSAALARPTTVRGLSGVLNNVMPVLQQQAKATRVGTEGRAEALTAMQLAQNRGAMDLADQEVETELKLAELRSKDAKANLPNYQVLPPGSSVVDFTQLARLPLMTPAQVREAMKNPANRGRQFRTTDNRIGTL